MVLRSINLIRIGNYALVSMMVVMMIATHSALVTFSPVLSSKILADAIRRELKPGDVVEINGEYEAGSTLGFYLLVDASRLRWLSFKDLSKGFRASKVWMTALSLLRV